MTIDVFVNGHAGRMAGLVTAALGREMDMVYCGRLVRPEKLEQFKGADPTHCDLSNFTVSRPVIVDFTAPEVTEKLLNDLAGQSCALVIGTSGINDKVLTRIKQFAERNPVLFASNFSIGVLLMNSMVAALAERLPAIWDGGVIDIHFRGKKDPFSATALALADSWTRNRGKETPCADVVALRQGVRVSEHRFLASGLRESLEVIHRVEDRDAFLGGILTAIRFVSGQKSGFYTLSDAISGEKV